VNALIYRRYGGPEVLELADVPQPQPRDREVLVRVHAASVNAADRVLLRGKPFVVRLGMGFPRPPNSRSRPPSVFHRRVKRRCARCSPSAST
jgi:NADPH:quinone reductase-like Zn-dependent oxidoreductase